MFGCASLSNLDEVTARRIHTNLDRLECRENSLSDLFRASELTSKTPYVVSQNHARRLYPANDNASTGTLCQNANQIGLDPDQQISEVFAFDLIKTFTHFGPEFLIYLHNSFRKFRAFLSRNE